MQTERSSERKKNKRPQPNQTAVQLKIVCEFIFVVVSLSFALYSCMCCSAVIHVVLLFDVYITYTYACVLSFLCDGLAEIHLLMNGVERENVFAD